MTDLSHLARPGTTLSLRVTPNARTADIRAEGDTIRIRVTVPPEKGKANAAVLKALSKALDVPKSRLEIASGATGRNKTLRIL
ncbi:hypothetical protein SAMN04488020_107167 [Palleronia marisminoris]|uniref:UPF0235 protein PAM7066_02640 n=1 Tax=Palleronia marisminoris TaxID=315423 RepID=A0A1Y5T446_9RHOB|nr:DUF167 domain-containing protein [Palleronia marisminoris]SFH16213.1 hypothetical protein SAMN04488020_107167 [Palleronia marisminoris]SLN55348.1 hypothetical protein PAM7066_02640 [Palleronia marisminoris]